MKTKLDVLIIGSGAVGNAIAREASKLKLNIAVLEKEPDTCFGTSGRNSGVLHAGFNNKPGSLMAKLCVEGSEGFEKEAEALGIEFKRTGKLVTALSEEDIPALEKLLKQGEANGVKKLDLISEEKIREINKSIKGVRALWSGMTGVFDPFAYTVALAETAVANGVDYYFGRKVRAIEALDSGFKVYAENLSTGEEEIFETGIVVNSAGLFSDDVCRLVGIDKYKINPCRGEYHILDKRLGECLQIPVYPVPSERAGGLGIHLTPTIDGNIMIGPSAEYIDEKEAYMTTAEVMKNLSDEGQELLPLLSEKDFIRSFSGVRPKLTDVKKGGYADFIIEESKEVPGFIFLVGIESPGLTASIPIAGMVMNIAKGRLEILKGKAIEKKDNYRDRKKQFGLPLNGSKRMICRCEMVTEEDILKAFDDIKKLGAIPTVKGIKNRTRAGMGSCQGSFCTVDIVELLESKRGIDPLRLEWSGFESSMFSGRVR